MHRTVTARALVSPALLGVAFVAIAACSADRGATLGATSEPDASTASAAFIAPPTTTSPNPATHGVTGPNYNAGPPDYTHFEVQHGPRVEIARAESSLPLRDLPKLPRDPDEEEREHEPGRNPRVIGSPLVPTHDPVLQPEAPINTMPATVVNILAQGNTNSAATMSGTPPDTNGAVGPNHYVQVVNSGLAIWNKSGGIVAASAKINTLFTNYVGTNAGNGCAANNDGDPVVVYDTMADRWLITQFSLPNANSGPNFQCVAVSKTADPTGAYWLYDFQYPGLNDYGKFGVWPDAYYATFNMFNTAASVEVCAYDRVGMLAGQPATQQCFSKSNGIFGLLPVSVEGHVNPPRGEPGFIAGIANTNTNGFDLWKFHVDWVTPANSTFTGPTTLPIVAFSPTCNGGACVPQPSPGNKLATLSDRPMFRLTYRNFGTHESLLVNHSVSANGAGGIRWYEVRAPNGTPVVFQQGTYAPNDGNWRWMGSIAQDQAEGFALGFSISSTTRFPSMAWTGRINSDTAGVMGQGETVVDDGTGVETGKFTNGQTAQRWGDYSNMTVDPVDDCTFWYTSELYHVTGPIPKTWDTQIAAFKFPNCAANNFSITVVPATVNVAAGAQVTYTVLTAPTAGTPESITLNVQDLPTGVTAAFNPATINAGATSALTLTAAANAPSTGAPVTFTVIGKAASAVHPASAAINVGPACSPLTQCPPPVECGSMPDTCGGTLMCSSCGNGMTCVANRCVPGTVGDAGKDSGGTVDSGELPDSGPIVDNDSGAGQGDAATADAPSDNSSGCGCRTVESRTTSSPFVLGLGALALIGALRRRARRRQGAMNVAAADFRPF